MWANVTTIEDMSNLCVGTSIIGIRKLCKQGIRPQSQRLGGEVARARPSSNPRVLML